MNALLPGNFHASIKTLAQIGIGKRLPLALLITGEQLAAAIGFKAEFNGLNVSTHGVLDADTRTCRTAHAPSFLDTAETCANDMTVDVFQQLPVYRVAINAYGADPMFLTEIQPG
ncbi:hypothetical protein CO611_09245 [Lysobacteraceae bacterium NML03-0222]|nr:hypothetical protein CO611_09245 [Xanthomonadaceae bacterium NML03-0222]